MKYSILFISLIILSCATADINIDEAAVKSLKVIALVPFKSTSSADNLKTEIYEEAEEVFSSALVRMNFKIIPKEKMGIESVEKKSISSDAVLDDAVKSAISAGADAVLIGDIIVNEEVVRDIHPRKTIFFSGLKFRERDDEIKTQTIYKFQISVKIVDVKNGSVILSMKNRYIEAEKDDYLPGYLSLDTYRALTLKKLSDEMVEKLNPGK